jgi:hypothetical protein
MKLLVVSDTHGDSACVRTLLERYAAGGSVQMAFHLGDNADDLMRFEASYPAVQMVAVAGNCDYKHQHERLLTIHGRRFLLLHGHRQNVKVSADRLAYYAQEKGADVCLFGHTHRSAKLSQGHVLLFNPGSASEPRWDNRYTYGLITVTEDGLVEGTVLDI